MWQARQEQSAWDPRRDERGVVTIDEPSDREADRARCGSGNCSKCNCPQWEGNGSQCDNCGHAWTAHN